MSPSYKENTKMPLQSKYKYIKNTMAAGIAQKSYKILLSLWSRKKKGILKLIKQNAEERLEALERMVMLKQ